MSTWENSILEQFFYLLAIVFVQMCANEQETSEGQHFSL